MRKLTGTEYETILKRAGGVIGDVGFIGTDCITTPARKPGDREHDYNNQVNSLRAPVERAVANLKTWQIVKVIQAAGRSIGQLQLRITIMRLNDPL